MFFTHRYHYTLPEYTYSGENLKLWVRIYNYNIATNTLCGHAFSLKKSRCPALHDQLQRPWPLSSRVSSLLLFLPVRVCALRAKHCLYSQSRNLSLHKQIKCRLRIGPTIRAQTYNWLTPFCLLWVFPPLLLSLKRMSSLGKTHPSLMTSQIGIPW